MAQTLPMEKQIKRTVSEAEGRTDDYHEGQEAVTLSDTQRRRSDQLADQEVTA